MNEKLRGPVLEALEKAKQVVFGQEKMLEAITAALVCEGHLLIEGMPGLAKTLSVNVMAKLCNLDFKRVQFTPDLLPSDLIGTMVYNHANATFSTKFGPIFTQLLLADEINRSPAKVQAALLEAMAEKQVTIGEVSHRLKSPFVVMATQNPIEQEGTYPLPEAQLDRFMMKIAIGYPDEAAEMKILDLKKSSFEELTGVLNAQTLFELQKEVESVYVDNKIKELIVKLVRATRPENKLLPPEIAPAVTAGCSPRATIWLYKIAKFKAYMDQKDFVSPEHILQIVEDVMGHRMHLSYEAALDGITGRSVALKVAHSLL